MGPVEKKIRLDKGQIEAVDDLMADFLRGKTAAERIRIGPVDIDQENVAGTSP